MNIVILLGVLVTVLTGAPVLQQMLKHHPRGLIVLFFAEMWERFSYYGMRGLLIFYLTQHFLFDDKFSNSQYGSYTSLVYLLPLLGGFLADRYLGTRKAIAFGALLLVAGHLTMAVEGAPARQVLSYAGQSYPVQVEGRGDVRQVTLGIDGGAYAYGPAPNGGLAVQGLPAGASVPAVLPAGSYAFEVQQRDPFYVNVFYLALALIIMGVGFLKPNISTLVGQLYEQGDPRRDPGFTLYYYGINLGSFWAAILCGYLGQTVGWWAGFGLAGIGMLAGYVVFVWGRPLLLGHGEPPDPAKLKQKVAGPLNIEAAIYLGAIAGVGLVFLLVQNYALVGAMLGIGIVAALSFIGWFLATKCNRVERERMLLALVLMFGAAVYWTAFEQAGNSLNLFADRNVDLALTRAPVEWLGGLVTLATPAQLAAAGGAVSGLWIDTTLTASQTQSFNAGWLLILAPVFAALWGWLGRRGRDLDPLIKFGLALVQVGLGFLVLKLGQGYVDADFRVPLVFLALMYLLHTTGELFLSPVGLSAVTKLSVASMVSFMMATWFLAQAVGQYVGGAIAGLTGTETVGGQVLDPGAALATSMDVFVKIGWAAIGFGVLFLILSPLLKRWGHGLVGGSADPALAHEPVAPAVDGDLQGVTRTKLEREDGV